MLKRAGVGVLCLFSMIWCWGCSNEKPDVDPYDGVTRALATERAARVSDIVYGLTFRIPEQAGEPLGGSLTIRFQLSDASQPLVLDFQAPADHLQAVTSKARPVAHEFSRGRIVLPADVLSEGTNSFELSFQPSDIALNRREEYLYSLFVPDRASTAFPCFDQPDLKGRFRLILSMPESWTSVSNGTDLGSMLVGERKTTRFAETDPLSTYQFAFAAGRFQVVERKLGERAVRVFHRETDQEKVNRNIEAIMALHEQALRWMENYTGIPFPYQKFDFVLLPSFQFGGMEHPGAIYYRDSSLLLEPSATKTQELGRAHLIAHETSHMWFGNLVTMRWFNDVWMKEVFANFMAAKIVDPSFPEIDHDLRFVLDHQPGAYDVDRSRGTHPIRQELDNLKYAASLYGAIIYQKAPVVMRQLEEIIGEEALRNGLSQYLDRFRFGNADWNDLVAILDGLTERDLAGWSQVWVEEAGRPTVELSQVSGSGTGLQVTQHDPAGKDRLWPEWVTAAVIENGVVSRAPVFLDGADVPVDLASGRATGTMRLPNVSPAGYAYFRLDPDSTRLLLQHVGLLDSPAARAQAWLAIWDGVLDGRAEGALYNLALVDQIPREPDELLREFLLGLLRQGFWLYGDRKDQDAVSAMEAMLWNGLLNSPAAGAKKAYLKTLQSVAITPDSVRRLTDIWNGTTEIAGLQLGEEDRTDLAFALALRLEGAEGQEVLDSQASQIRNPERRDEFNFERTAVAPEASEREAFFRSILDSIGDVRETWALNSVQLLTHPLRGEEGVSNAAAGLQLLPEVERKGSIFFPKRWLDALLSGKSSAKLSEAVQSYLEDHPELPQRLRLKVLQSADKLFRSAQGLR